MQFLKVKAVSMIKSVCPLGIIHVNEFIEYEFEGQIHYALVSPCNQDVFPGGGAYIGRSPEDVVKWVRDNIENRNQSK